MFEKLLMARRSQKTVSQDTNKNRTNTVANTHATAACVTCSDNHAPKVIPVIPAFRAASYWAISAASVSTRARMSFSSPGVGSL
jgi:hypothetical protein